MFGLIGGLFLACLTFYLVHTRFDSRLWVNAVSALLVLALCTFTGMFGCIVVGLALGALFKADF